MEVQEPCRATQQDLPQKSHTCAGGGVAQVVKKGDLTMPSTLCKTCASPGTPTLLASAVLPGHWLFCKEEVPTSKTAAVCEIFSGREVACATLRKSVPNTRPGLQTTPCCRV